MIIKFRLKKSIINNINSIGTYFLIPTYNINMLTGQIFCYLQFEVPRYFSFIFSFPENNQT